MNIISIDPGKTGAIACLTTECELVSLIDMPLIQLNNQTYINVVKIIEFINDNKVKSVIIEKVGSQATDSKQSIFTFGKNTGAMQSAVACAVTDIKYILPQKWKSATGFIKKDKKAPAKKCCEIYGAELFTGPRGGLLDGRGDAVMIGIAAIKLGMFK
tara:strand:- start:16702 stop:17175 length:474 start_codon:yes stop_codon:yes gene_type:complete